VKVGTGQFVEAGNEIHYYAGSKVVIDAGMELTASGGGSFLKLDPSGVTLSGATIKMNSGGAPGVGTGIGIVLPIIPGAADADKVGSLLGVIAANIPLEALVKQRRVFLQADTGICEICEAAKKAKDVQ
jgi:type VI secretion system secreted protein VgrG